MGDYVEGCNFYEKRCPPGPVPPVPCFKCGKELASVFRDIGDASTMPNDAVIFTAQGNYGSTVFDPFDGSFLEINICDSCLVAGRANVYAGSRSGAAVSKWDGPDVEVISMSTEEWKASAQRALEKLGLTYDELKQQAESGRFDSIEARKLWMMIGETV